MQLGDAVRCPAGFETLAHEIVQSSVGIASRRRGPGLLWMHVCRAVIPDCILVGRAGPARRTTSDRNAVAGPLRRDVDGLAPVQDRGWAGGAGGRTMRRERAEILAGFREKVARGEPI